MTSATRPKNWFRFQRRNNNKSQDSPDEIGEKLKQFEDQIETEPSPRALSVTSLTSAASAPFCRICHDDDTEEPLISPCHCKGSLNFCHTSCLHSWLTEKVHDLKEPSCEICKCKYEVRYERVGKRDCGSSCRQFRERREFIHFIVFLFCILVLCASVSYTSWGAFSPSALAINFRLSPLAELTYSVYLIIDALCILVIVVEFKVGILPIVKKWWNSNISVVVLDKNRNPICTENLRTVEEASSLLEDVEEAGEEENDDDDSDGEDSEAEISENEQPSRVGDGDRGGDDGVVASPRTPRWWVKFWPRGRPESTRTTDGDDGDLEEGQGGRGSAVGTARNRRRRRRRDDEAEGGGEELRDLRETSRQERRRRRSRRIRNGDQGNEIQEEERRDDATYENEGGAYEGNSVHYAAEDVTLDFDETRKASDLEATDYGDSINEAQ